MKRKICNWCKQYLLYKIYSNGVCFNHKYQVMFCDSNKQWLIKCSKYKLYIDPIYNIVIVSAPYIQKQISLGDTNLFSKTVEDIVSETEVILLFS